MLERTCFHDMPNGGTAKRNRAKSGKASDLRGGGGGKANDQPASTNRTSKDIQQEIDLADKQVRQSLDELTVISDDLRTAEKTLYAMETAPSVYAGERPPTKRELSMGVTTPQPKYKPAFSKKQLDEQRSSVAQLQESHSKLETTWYDSRVKLGRLQSEYDSALRKEYAAGV